MVLLLGIECKCKVLNAKIYSPDEGSSVNFATVDF